MTGSRIAALLCGMVLGLGSMLPAEAATVRVAVAANFTKVAEQLAAGFEAQTGNNLLLSFGATGALYTQITQGAPFDIFLSADDTRTKTAIAEGFAVEGSEFTYAVGALALYAPTLDLTDGAAVLEAGAFQHLAIADPATAPYGAAALVVLVSLGVAEAVAPKIVTGGSVTQALAFVDSASAELGFVALSQVMDRPQGQVWRVPQETYPAIRQNAVLLMPGAANDAARTFLDYLRGDDAVAIIKAGGYDVP